jgi:carbon monoxide dehydrogenase subunit G
MQRTKGAAFEREIANAIGAKRNIGQARDGGDDITHEGYRIECKRRASVGPMKGWMEQAVASLRTPDETPVVICRGDGGEAYVILRFTDWVAEKGFALRKETE